MGPYYISGLVSLLGPVARVFAAGLRARDERTVHLGPIAGTNFTVEVPTTVQLTTVFEAGQQAQSLLSFDSALERHGVFEVHGTEGTIVLPDPNQFEGRIAYVKPLGVLRDGAKFEQEWIDVPQQGAVVGRGLGLLDMVRAIAEDRPHVASGRLGLHVLDVMLSAEQSVESGQAIEIGTTVDSVPSVPADFDPFAATL